MESWTRDPLPADLSPVDLSFMNESPAGSHGFLHADGDRLVFEDGTPARFWGLNIQASALFRTKDSAIVRHAKRIAQLGFNLVRLHHHDSTGFVKPALIDHKLPHSQAFNPRAQARFDLWISELKKNGVYVWLDLHTGRVFKEGDEIPGFEELLRGKKPGEGKGFLYLNTRLQELMRKFNETFLGHVNPHTGLAYKDDPVVIGVLITNENDVTHHFGRNFRLSGNLHHRGLFAEALKAFSAKSGVSEAKVLAGRTRIGTKLWLSQIEHDFNVGMRAHLAKLGFRGVVATTNLWAGGRLH
ncbi:MAG: glycosyl hydrolase family 5, partial [Deltaproteobacteria bacterium]|nr:glycosyl hydrolase family 5 [Deltaproteobacteria bacterium]